MKFDQETPIYIQIENFIKDKIFQKIWKPNERIPSVREMAATLEVNPNTIMRTYEKLQSSGILNTQRGLGYFVQENAITIIEKAKMEKFITELESVFKTMQMLNIPIEVLTTQYYNFNNKPKG